MAARRRRAGTRKTAGVKQAALKRAGLLAHNRRLASAVSTRLGFGGGKTMMQGYNEARIGRVRRRARVPSPGLALRRARGRAMMADRADATTYRLAAIPSKVARKSPVRRYKRDSRGRFSR